MQANWVAFITWVTANGELIKIIAALVGVLGTVAGAVTLIFAYVQLRQTKRALQAGNTYTIQKEAREIAAGLQADEKFRSYVIDPAPGAQFDSATIRHAQNKIAMVFHFYLSVYRQARARGITRVLIASMGKDFIQFFSNTSVQNYYDLRREAGGYDVEYQDMVAFWQKKSR